MGEPPHTSSIAKGSRGGLVIASRLQIGQCLIGQNRTKTEQGRVGPGRMRAGEAAFLGFRLSDLFGKLHRSFSTAYLSN